MTILLPAFNAISASKIPKSQRISVIATAQASSVAFKPTKPTLFDVPVSNNGARIRWIIYKKGLENDIDIKPPAEIGGLKSEEYLALNAQGKMPLLVIPNHDSLFPLPESQVIETYMLDKYKGVGPDLVPSTPEGRAVAALAARIHDLYIAPIQGCMYKSYDDPALRRKQLGDINFQLNVLESIIQGPFVAGKDISFGDGSLVPTFVFLTWILPRYFNWSSIFTNRPKLEAWWNAVQNDPESARIIKEIESGLEAWAANDRWKKVGVLDQVADTSIDWSCGC